MPLNFVPKSSINKNPALGQIIALQEESMLAKFIEAFIMI